MIVKATTFDLLYSFAFLIFLLLFLSFSCINMEDGHFFFSYRKLSLKTCLRRIFSKLRIQFWETAGFYLCFLANISHAIYWLLYIMFSCFLFSSIYLFLILIFLLENSFSILLRDRTWLYCLKRNKQKKTTKNPHFFLPRNSYVYCLKYFLCLPVSCPITYDC